jgi:hypothetical protein
VTSGALPKIKTMFKSRIFLCAEMNGSKESIAESADLI